MRRDEVPDRLAHLPFDERRGLPVPVMNQHHPHGPDGPVVADFTAVAADQILRCGTERLCGICGRDLGYWVAFVGGPVSARTRMYTDPGFHEECVDWALRLCPFIVIPRHRRASDDRAGRDAGVAGRVGAPKDATMVKADEWVVGITRSYAPVLYQGYPAFKAAPWKRTRRFTYEDGVLTEQPD